MVDLNRLVGHYVMTMIIIFILVIAYTLTITIILAINWKRKDWPSKIEPFYNANEELFENYPPDGHEPPSVSIIIPMMNEETKAKKCVDSLMSQSFPNLEMIVVFDKSTDRTEEILKELSNKYAKLRVIESEPKPNGWIGKIWAQTQAVKAAKGQLLLFMDADVTAPHPHVISAAVEFKKANKIDMLSLYPTQKMFSFWEKVLQPMVFTVIGVFRPPDKVNDPANPMSSANGQFILIDREVYDAVGGHAANKSILVENYALAKLVKGSGYRLFLDHFKAEFLNVRMYISFWDSWDGWMRMLYPALYGGGTSLASVLMFIFSWGIFPFIVLLISIIWLFAAGSTLSLLFLIVCLYLVTLNIYGMWMAMHIYGIPKLYAFLLPISASVVAALLITSAYKVKTGKEVLWKGRRYKEIV